MKPAFGKKKKTKKEKKGANRNLQGTCKFMCSLSASCKLAMFTVNVSAKHYF